MLAYVENKIVKAIGFAMPERKVLHGKSIPQGIMCMQLQYAGKDVPAPVVLGNDDENSYLQAGMFFALPIENLFFLYWHPKCAVDSFSFIICVPDIDVSIKGPGSSNGMNAYPAQFVW